MQGSVACLVLLYAHIRVISIGKRKRRREEGGGRREEGGGRREEGGGRREEGGGRREEDRKEGIRRGYYF